MRKEYFHKAFCLNQLWNELSEKAWQLSRKPSQLM